MAPPAGTLRVSRYFMALLAIIAVLYAIVFWPGQRHTPKLGLDLVGGSQVIFTAKTPNGHSPSKSQMNQAKQIMTDRVNGSGVTQSEVVIQGSNQIVVSIPGSTGGDLASLGKAAVLSLRGSVMPAVPMTCTTTAGATPSSASTTPPAAQAGTSTAASPKDARNRRLNAPTTTPAVTPSTTPASSTGTATGSATPSASPSTTAAPTPCKTNPFVGLTFPVPTTEDAYNKLTSTQQQQLQAALSDMNCDTANTQSDTAPYYIACDDGKTYGAKVVYLLGKVIVPGNQISGASSQAPNPSAGLTEWTVQLSMKTSGQTAWANYTGAHNTNNSQNSSSALQCATASTPCADFVGFVLDGRVISAPVNQSAINGGKTQITGNFSQSTANQLSNQLKYGALPLSFTPQDTQTVSATLGTSQLKAGLLAGGIGLLLVVLYSLVYYRALGLVTIASLLVSGALTYGCLVMLATQISFTLSLAGIAGFIVAVGITADSFVVFFERMKDEVHEGRSARVAIPRAWVRARRTILSADTVSFLAAAILYYFAAGDVKGFAFTLGLSTILDLVVVFLFTHPLVSVLSRLRNFGSSTFTGLDAIRGGAAVSDTPAPARPAKRARPAQAARPAAEPTTSAVAVAERPDEAKPAEAAPAAGPAADVDADITDERLVDEEPTDDPSAAGEERRHTTPAPGTAAERAAARRARLRDEKGES
ncbi:MAG TPA: protein translocase subunit SecD [Jatrophihabitantaceae bacterium]|nr:protein translocase subunit SecD [Jatrophihabitantaceae bacterium]